MKTNCFCFILLLTAFTAFAATKVELKSDKSVAAEIAQDKAKQIISVSLSFVPVSTLDDVTNDEMTETLARFFAEEALSALKKTPQSVTFSKTRCIVHKKTSKQCSLTYQIPAAAISDVQYEQVKISAPTLKKYLATVSSDAVLQDFRSTCFHDLRIAEAFFLDQIKTCKNKDQLEKKIINAFGTLEKKIHDDDALFLSEKEDLLNKTKSIRRFLLQKLSSAEISSDIVSDAESASASSKFADAEFLPEYKSLLLSNPVLLSIGGCKAFHSEQGKIYLIAVGKTAVRNASARERLRCEEAAEQKAFGELAKHQEVEVTFFSERNTSRTVSTRNGIESNGSSMKTGKTRITIKSEAFFRNMNIVGKWYSADRRFFYIAIGGNMPSEREE